MTNANRPTKVLWFDTETTGTDPLKHAIIQIAMVVEIEGKVYEEKTINIGPGDAEIEDEALAVNRTSRDDLAGYQSPVHGLQEIREVFGRHVDRYDKNDKFTVGGHNVKFDVDFLRAFFERNAYPEPSYFGSWFNGRRLDTLELATWLQHVGILGASLPNLKLGTLAKYLGVKFSGSGAHDALSDIKANVEIANDLRRVLNRAHKEPA